MAILYLVRVGRTDLSHEGRLQGRTDHPLSPAGVADASRAASLLAEAGAAAIYTSPLARARRTAEVIGHLIGRRPVVRDDLVDVELDGGRRGPTRRSSARTRARSTRTSDTRRRRRSPLGNGRPRPAGESSPRCVGSSIEASTDRTWRSPTSSRSGSCLCACGGSRERRSGIRTFCPDRSRRCARPTREWSCRPCSRTCSARLLGGAGADEEASERPRGPPRSRGGPCSPRTGVSRLRPHPRDGASGRDLARDDEHPRGGDDPPPRCGARAVRSSLVEGARATSGRPRVVRSPCVVEDRRGGFERLRRRTRRRPSPLPRVRLPVPPGAERARDPLHPSLRSGQRPSAGPALSAPSAPGIRTRSGSRDVRGLGIDAPSVPPGPRRPPACPGGRFGGTEAARPATHPIAHRRHLTDGSSTQTQRGVTMDRPGLPPTPGRSAHVAGDPPHGRVTEARELLHLYFTQAMELAQAPVPTG